MNARMCIGNDKLDQEIQTWLRMMDLSRQMYEMRKEFEDLKSKTGMKSSGMAVFEVGNINAAFDKKRKPDNEKTYIYAGILKQDIDAAEQYFNAHCKNNFATRTWHPTLRQNAFWCLLQHPDRLWELVSITWEFGKIGWLNEERDLAYKVYNEFWKERFGPGINDIYAYVKLFQHRCDRETIDLLLKRIVGRKNEDMAREFMANPALYGLTQDDCDLLNGVLMYRQLSKR